jgi:hypothetical protein
MRIYKKLYQRGPVAATTICAAQVASNMWHDCQQSAIAKSRERHDRHAMFVLGGPGEVDCDPM